MSELPYCSLQAFPVRGVLLTKGPDSSFAEAHRRFNSEPIHIEDEVKDRRMKKKMGEVRREGRRETKHTSG